MKSPNVASLTTMSVAMLPGQTTFTRMRSGPSSVASVFAIPTRPCLAVT